MGKKQTPASSPEKMKDVYTETETKPTEDSPTEWLRKIFDVLSTISDTQMKILAELKNSNTIIQTTNLENSNRNKTHSEFSNTEKVGNWQQLLSKRKHAYYNKIRSEGIMNVYTGFLAKNPPFIPAKFREKLYPGITNKQRENKNKLEKMRVEMEIDHLNEQKEKNQEILEEIEADIKAKILTVDEPVARQSIKEKWIAEISKEEKKSMKTWDKKKNFLLEVESEMTSNTIPNYYNSSPNTVGGDTGMGVNAFRRPQANYRGGWSGAGGGGSGRGNGGGRAARRGGSGRSQGYANNDQNFRIGGRGRNRGRINQWRGPPR